MSTGAPPQKRQKNADNKVKVETVLDVVPPPIVKRKKITVTKKEADDTVKVETLQDVLLPPIEKCQKIIVAKKEPGEQPDIKGSLRNEHQNMPNIYRKAEAHCRSFGDAMALRDSNPSATTTDIAEALYSHHAPKGFIAFSMGATHEAGTKDQFVPAMANYLKAWDEGRLGLNFRVDKFRVQVLSPSAALCFLIWRYFPKPEADIKTWSWETIYTFRIIPEENADGYWESCIYDNEITSVLQRFSDFGKSQGQ